jgi:hypothetical protein
MKKTFPSPSAGILAALLSIPFALWSGSTIGQGAIPIFSPDSRTGWIAGDPKGENPIGQDYLPPESGPGPVTNDPVYPHVDDGAARRDGKQPTYRVADLRNPILQPWVREALRKENARAISGKPDFTPKERCWPIGVPGWVLYPVRPVYFLQTPKEVTLIWEEDHMVRHIYLTARHSANVKPSWFGESIGHYENGDTLVVDTIGLNDKTFVDSYRTPHTTQLHVVERYRLTNGGNALDVSVRVEDPGAFTMPWSARQVYRRSNDGPQVEASCAENNSAWFGYGDIEPIPQATKPDF